MNHHHHYHHHHHRHHHLHHHHDHQHHHYHHHHHHGLTCSEKSHCSHFHQVEAMMEVDVMIIMTIMIIFILTRENPPKMSPCSAQLVVLILRYSLSWLSFNFFFELAIFPTTQKSFSCIPVMVLFGGHICHTVNFLSGEMKNDDDLMEMLLL